MRPNSERIRADLETLISIESITGNEGAVQQEMTRLMAAAGLEVVSFDTDVAVMAADPSWPGSEMPRETLPVVSGSLKGETVGPSVLLLGHVDVVPPGDPTSWTTPAFQPAVRNGHIFGRGSCDMKGGVVAALEAMRLIAESDRRIAGEVKLVTVPSEEDGGGGALAAVRAGLVGDMCVIPEPTRLQVVVAHAGAITFTLEIPGKAAHASTRREGVSALDKLALVLEGLREDEHRRNSAETEPLMADLGLPYPTIVGKVRGGDWASMVMDALVVEGRYGVRLGQTPAEAEEELRSAIAAVWEADDFLSGRPMRLEISGGRFGPAQTESDHPLPQGLLRAAESFTGTLPGVIGVPYGADMRLLMDEGDTPTVMYGPGDIRVAHSADEHVSLEEVETCAAVLATWLLAELS